MADQEITPIYMAHLLDELGWSKGTRIPLANPENQALEVALINRHNELQRLKEAIALQKQRQDDLDKYKGHVQSEYQENTRLLLAHKQQMEQEVKLKQIASSEADMVERSVLSCSKQDKEIQGRIEKVQTTIAKMLKKADTLKAEVCTEDRVALREWRAALERAADDITAIEHFTKQDTSKAKELEMKRQKLKVEHDKMSERLAQVVTNLCAEERACERIAVQVEQGMEQRKQMLTMWTAAVENLRQRDNDIRHVREDFEILEKEAQSVAEQSREQQHFLDQQIGNNAEAERENAAISAQLGRVRMQTLEITEQNHTLLSEVQSLQRVLANMRSQLEKLHMQNRQIMDDQHKKDNQLRSIVDKVNDLKVKLVESQDKSKSAEKRAKQLEEMLNDEERYASQVTANQQRAMHCSFVEQQKLLALKNEEKLFHMQLKSSKAVMDKLDVKQAAVERMLQTQKESLYQICYQAETLGARILHMEGVQAERAVSAELLAREQRLLGVRARHSARVALLERHAAKLADELRALTKDLEVAQAKHTSLQDRLRTAMLKVEGGEKDLKALKEELHRTRVEEALLKLRVAQSARALAQLDNKAFNIDKQKLQLDAAMSERLIEIGVRRDMFSVQRRAIFEDCGKLRCQIKEREGRIEQLKKRYDILIASLGKDESGQQVSVAFFKIKFASERAELRERGAALDTQVARAGRDVAALEATLRVMNAAHQHFLHKVQPLAPDTPEMIELGDLQKQYYELRDELKQFNAEVAALDEAVSSLTERHTLLNDKNKQLLAREAEADSSLQEAMSRVQQQNEQLEHARDVVKRNAKRAKRLMDNEDAWRIFQIAVWVRDYAESAFNALRTLWDLCGTIPEANVRMAVLVVSHDLEPLISDSHKKLKSFVRRIVAESHAHGEAHPSPEECVFSTSSEESARSSRKSGHGRNLRALHGKLAESLQEPQLSALRDRVPVKVVSLDFTSSAVFALQPTTKNKPRPSKK